MEHAGPSRDSGDPYRVLGVNAGASQRDIARAYRRAAQRAHPDTQPRDRQAAARFQALTDAYDLLRDPGRRADYDRGHPARTPSRQPQPARPGARLRRPGSPFLLGPPPGQLIWAGPVHVEPPATTPPASPHGRGAPAAEFDDPVIIFGVRPGQVWGWPG
ncbi:MAG: DnaJ domain-containing protein [Actinobacteria bacterium]|nr:DnaJ domain-containing protein [Actinomycetota bacterium]